MITLHKPSTWMYAVHPILSSQKDAKDALIYEGHTLLLSNNYSIGVEESFIIKDIRPATFIGLGMLNHIVEDIQHSNLESPYTHCFFNTSLTAVQKRNIEKIIQIPVFDRIDLILDIFTKRSTTRIGKIQAKLAYALYGKSSLARKWSHLERQRSGGSFLGGPGESQLELDKRLLNKQIIYYKKELQQYHKTKMVQQHGRKNTVLVAFVGYTNVGKSSLFNRLTYADGMVGDQLFATLHPTVRKLKTTHHFLCVDTVGLISDLPSFIMAGFAETFNIITLADIIVHVKDASTPWRKRHDDTVTKVLEELHVSEDIPIISLWNKADLLSKAEQHKYKQHLLCSAKQKDLNPIVQAILSAREKTHQYNVLIPYECGSLLGRLMQLKGYLQPKNQPNGWKVQLYLTQQEFHSFEKHITPYLLIK